jgi:predicted acylesterase/phospholipase RssA
VHPELSGQSPPSAAALDEVPLLAGLPAELRARLAAEARTVRVAAGDWLFRAGDEAHSLFVTRSGRLEVVSADAPPVVIGVLKRGSVLGELALLGDGRRAASVFARRDSELLELRREQFEWLIANAPSFAIGLMRSVGRQLAASHAPHPPSPVQTLGIVALDAGAPAAEVGALLATALRAFGSLAVLRREDAGHPDERGALLGRVERDHDRVLLAGGDAGADERWAAFCRDEADLVVAVGSGAPDGGWTARPAALHGCELLVVGAGPTERAIEAIAPRELHVVGGRARLAGAVEALARRVVGRAIGLVLSGGGARAFAHLGVCDELHARGVQVDRTGGTSMGAVVGAFMAMNVGPDEMRAAAECCFVQQNPANDYAVPAFSLIRGRKTRRMLEENFGDVRIEQLPRRFYCVSCDLVARELVVHRTGLLRDALYASLAIPGIYPPLRDRRGRLLVDGGVLDNLPVEPMARTGAGPVIAVDVGQYEMAPTPARPRRRLARLGSALTGTELQLPRIGETLLRTLTTGSADTVAAALRHADVVIAPRVEDIGMLDWKALDRARAIGRRAAREALDAQDVVVVAPR